MANLKFDKEITGLLVIDPYNDFISEGGKFWDRLKTVAEANNCVPNMLQVLRSSRPFHLTFGRRGSLRTRDCEGRRVVKNFEGGIMKRIALLLVAFATVPSVVASTAPASGSADGEESAI